MTPSSPRLRASKSNQAIELQSKINKWATDNGCSEDPYIRELSASLESGKDLAALSDFNPMEVLPYPSLAGADRRNSLSNNLAIIRNVLVFTPVALTWISINKSTTAFAAYTQANKGSVVNFLEFWQNGYGVLSKMWRIADVAFLDFLIILTVIALTLTTAFMNKSRMTQQRKFAARASVGRIEIAIEINKYLFTQRTPTPSSINQSVTAALRSLHDASKELQKASKEIFKDIKEIPSNKQVLAELKKMNEKR